MIDLFFNILLVWISACLAILGVELIAHSIRDMVHHRKIRYLDFVELLLGLFALAIPVITAIVYI